MGRGVDGGHRSLVVHDQDAGANRLHHRLREPTALLEFLVLPNEPGARELHFLFAAGETLGHAVEGSDEGPELLASGRKVNPHPALPGRDALCPLRHEPHGRRDAAGKVEREPHRPEEEEERREEVQREVEGEDRLPIGLRLAELRVSILDLACARRDLGGQVGGDDHRPRRGAVLPADGNREPDELPRPEGHGGFRLAPLKRGLRERFPRGGVPGGGGRKAWVHDGDDLAPARVDVHEVQLELSRPGLDRPPQGALSLPLEEAARPQLAGEGPGVHAAAIGHRFTKRRAQRLGRGQDAFRVHVEPPVHRLADEIAADEDQQERGGAGH